MRVVFIMYVDESGDDGPTPPSPTRYFVLSALVVHELSWLSTLDALVAFRRAMKNTYGLPMRTEIHAVDMIRHPCGLTVPKWQRLQLLGDVLWAVAALPNISIMSVKIDKQRKAAGYDIFEAAWKFLIQRFQNTLAYRNFPGPQNTNERGIVVADETNEKRLRLLLRRMRRFNVVPGMGGLPARPLPTTAIVKDPIMRHSGHSYFIQMVDVAAYFLHQMCAPNAFVRRQGAKNFYQRLRPVACTVASPNDPHGMGIVHQ